MEKSRTSPAWATSDEAILVPGLGPFRWVWSSPTHSHRVFIGDKVLRRMFDERFKRQHNTHARWQWLKCPLGSFPRFDCVDVPSHQVGDAQRSVSSSLLKMVMFLFGFLPILWSEYDTVPPKTGQWPSFPFEGMQCFQLKMAFSLNNFFPPLKKKGWDYFVLYFFSFRRCHFRPNKIKIYIFW